MSANGLARCARKIFIGDVHGCFDELRLLLNKIGHDPKRDELYFVGDIVAKGPKSNECVDLVQNTPRTYSILGNHDYEVLRVGKACNIIPSHIKIPTFSFSQYVARDPLSMTNHQRCAEHISQSNIEYLASMPLYLQPHPKLRVVHAGIIPNVSMDKQDAWNLMNIRNIIEKPTPKHTDLMIAGKPAKQRAAMEGTGYHDLGDAWYTFYDGPEHIFYGHDAKRRLQTCAYTTGLDTGCCYGGFLTAAVVKYIEDTDELIHEGNEQQYALDDWEQNTKRYVSDAGLVYRLYQQKAERAYTPMHKDLGMKRWHHHHHDHHEDEDVQG
eukprot:CAMPEP_0197037430 /NCGR_PEP_ID=MMETSP1384-20130603/14645_1 /TAXON_ID=29189 /ORGANISM="Ammonia sp." /LENGTH=324 /DNA_ID=CAMNT_0042467735 /DNA_START=42 /DNA_END=1016 /DNA_ORIENTATION=-